MSKLALARWLCWLLLAAAVIMAAPRLAGCSSVNRAAIAVAAGRDPSSALQGWWCGLPDADAASYLLGLRQAEMGQLAEASACFDALQPSPRALLGYARLGSLYLQRGAIAMAGRSWARVHPRPAALLDLLTDLRVREHHEEALALSEAVLAEAPDDTEAIRVYAQAVYAVRRDLPRAVAAIQHWIALAPMQVDPYLLMADLYLQHGNPDEAMRWVEQAGSSAPGVLVMKARLLAQVGQQGAAQQVLRQVLAAEPDSSAALYYLGSLLEQAGQWEEALYHYRRAAITARPSRYTAGIYFALGQAERRAGNRQAAIAAFTKALEANPDDDRTRAALLALEE